MSTHLSTAEASPIRLPAGVHVFERGWLSSNNILCIGADHTALVDSGYCSHAPQTVALVQAALQGRLLDTLVNTHLHSDHCGGNAALQAAYPAVITHIPPGQADAVAHWDPVALSYAPTGQECPRFRFDHRLTPGGTVTLGDAPWQVHAAPGHDPHSVILFEPATRTLISADALWQHGFGVVFPELDGVDAFDDVAATLDVIDGLNVATVIPGHGAPFTDVDAALARARHRLELFVRAPDKHLRHGAKVLLKYKLLDWQAIRADALHAWAASVPYLQHLHHTHNGPGDHSAFAAWIEQLVDELVKAHAAVREARSDGVWLLNL